jgi:paraquat-inducible protein A
MLQGAATPQQPHWGAFLASPMPMATLDDSARWIDAESLGSLRECEDCGQFQRMPRDLKDGASAHCARCACTLRRSFRNGIELPLACACVAAGLLILTLSLPMLSVHTLGRFSSATVLSGPRRLIALGPWQLATLVLATLVAMPALKLGVTVTALTAAKRSWRSRKVAWAFALAPWIAPWSMVEVFLVGAGIAYTRLADMAEVDIGPALYAAAGFVLATTVADLTLDRELVWRCISRAPRENGEAHEEVTDAQLVGCDTCGLVSRARLGERCARCDHSLVHRKENSIARVWACVVAATILLVPANVLPVMTIVRLGHGGPRTILGGVVELADDRMYTLAIIVFVASVAIPLLKLATLVSMLIMTALRSSTALGLRTRLYRLLRMVGRWSMIDIFMLATLVGLMRLGTLANVLPDAGALAFAAVVALTMLATEWLDPRLMWDAVELRSDTSPTPDSEPT